ncbi:glycosyltransferase family 2 protein [Phenylobacterium soli]|uniref:Glycosyl transferase n=1 Tax=Phenylobacterium soli TaxID=2170551 RepID=A0A328AMS2_9CAUL|nr:glycosyltransferase family 2 protein [Phenylobacterium soli]RAK55837.1 glycosyl transferase [Phenylobacterium soli]
MTAERPVVSVITANFNGARHLAEAIASVQAQTLREWELIVADDASTDDSAGVVSRAAWTDPRVRLLRQPRNAGPGAARNAALAAARGRYLAIFDSDDLMAPDRLERLVRRAEADGAGIVADNLVAFDDGARPHDGAAFLDAAPFEQARWLDLADVIGSSRMYARRPGLGYLKPLICAAGLKTSGVRYDERLRIGEDYDVLLRLMASGLKLRTEPAALYFYRRHPASVSHAMDRRHLLSMLEADATFEADFPNLPAAARRAQAARRRSLERALTYDDVVRRLKAGDVKGGLVRGLAAPDVWPLLTLPVRARVRRLATRLAAA